MEATRVTALRERFEGYPRVQELIDKLTEPGNGLLISFGIQTTDDRYLAVDPEQAPLDWLEHISSKYMGEPDILRKLDAAVDGYLAILPHRTAAAANLMKRANDLGPLADR